MEVKIIGAGPVGLISAWYFAKRGIKCEVFEKGSLVGGMCRSFEWSGFTLDVGPHIFHTHNRRLIDFWISEFGDLLTPGEYWAANLQGPDFSELYGYPLSKETIENLPVGLRESALKDLERTSKERRTKSTTYKEYIDAQIGKTLRKKFFEKYPEKVWGIPTTKMTADWAPKRIRFTEKEEPFFGAEWTAISPTGTGKIYERVANKARQLGVSIHMDHPVSGLRLGRGSVEALLHGDHSETKIQESDILLSTVPLTLLGSWIGAKSRLKFRGIRLCYLKIDRHIELPKQRNWLYVDSPKILFNRVTHPRSMSRDAWVRSSDLIVVEVAYSSGDAVDLLPSDDFKRLVIEQVEQVGLVLSSYVEDSLDLKEPFVYPVQFADFQKELAFLQGEVSKFPQIFSLGTGGAFHYADSQILFEQSMELVDRICEQTTDIDRNRFVVSKVKPSAVIKANDFEIGNGNCFMIAELGINHNGDLAIAKKLIDEAVDCGFDAVKLQTFQPELRASSDSRVAFFSEKADGLEMSLDQIFKETALSEQNLAELFKYCKEKGVIPFSTPFDINAVGILESIGVELYKIASVDLVNLPLIKAVARTKRPVILSTGMATLGEVEEAVNTVLSEGNPNVVILHCNSTYPAPEAGLNLNVINTLKTAFSAPVGFSDHSIGTLACEVALTLGADVIEKHFTLSRFMAGPDHICSIEPAEAKELIDKRRRIRDILGSPIKEPQATESRTFYDQRRCIVAAADLPKGHCLRDDDILIAGPGGGIKPKYQSIVTGRVLTKDIRKHSPISWSDI